MAAIAVGSLDGAGALRPLFIAAAPLMSTLDHHTKPATNNNAAKHWLKTLFFIMSPLRRPRRSLLRRSIREVETAVHDLRGHVERWSRLELLNLHGANASLPQPSGSPLGAWLHQQGKNFQCGVPAAQRRAACP